MIGAFTCDYEFLSNFSGHGVVVHNMEYPTAEHAFQAMKTLDEDERTWVQSSSTPGIAKRRGRRVTLQPYWDDIKAGVMEHVLECKFSQWPELAWALIDTGDEHLVEGNLWHDNYWGNCICSRCRNIPGGNRLGKLLMELRQDLQDEQLRFDNNETF